MTLTFIRIDLLRQFRDIYNLMFVLLLPTLMYVVFGVSMGVASQPIGDGANVAFYVMGSMAAYGAALAALGATGSAAVEQLQGWGRQLGLTPARPVQIILGKVMVALVVTLAAVGIVHITGIVTGAKAPPAMWLATLGITVGGAMIFALFGYAMAMLFKSESALGVASGILVLMSFLGNVFMPLSGVMLEIARFTPMYGYVGLVRWPLMQGYQVTEGATPDTLAGLVANVAAWALIFGILALIGVRRSRRRN